MQPSDANHANPRLQAKLRSLYGMRGSPVIDLSIRPTFYELLRRLGDPHEKLPPVIHVAGTNGKGSTIAFMRAILQAAGYRVHVYTSPHLVRFNERIVLAGAEIGDGQLEALLDEVIAANGDLAQTFFEIKTAMAFAAFARVPADILLLEVGMGGRLDATNVVAHPAVTVITPIGLDHQEFLGPDVAAIAGEKAGIMKPGAPCVTAVQDNPAIDAVFKAAAARVECALYPAGAAWDVTGREDGIVFRFAGRTLPLPAPALTGAHQVANAGTALAALSCLPGFEISEAAMARGLRAVHWPGRLQRLPDPAPGWELWLDGAHNEHGARALARQMEAWAGSGRPVHLVFGMLKKKDPRAFLQLLGPHCDSLTNVPIAGEPESHSADTLGFAETQGWTLQFAENLQNGLNALYKAAAPGRVVIAGSLYLVGEELGFTQYNYQK